MQTWGVVVGLVLAGTLGCARRPLPAGPPAGDPPPANGAERGAADVSPEADVDPWVREGAVQNGFVTVRVALPPGASAPVPAVVTLLGEEEGLRALGIAAVSYRVHWEKLRGLAPPKAGTPPKPGAPAADAPKPRTWGKWLLASPSPRTVGQGYFQLISGDAEKTVPQVLDWLVTLPEIDSRRLGITGTSTNGFLALQAAQGDRRLRAVAVVSACGDYEAFLAESPLGLDGAEPLDLEPSYRRWLRAREPLRHPRRLVHAALLLVNGSADHAMPARCVERTASAFARAYERAGVPERFRFVLLPGGGHGYGEDARHEVLAWLQRWLVAPAPPWERRIRHDSRWQAEPSLG